MRSQLTRQARIIPMLEPDPTGPLEMMALFDVDGNPVELGSGGGGSGAVLHELYIPDSETGATVAHSTIPNLWMMATPDTLEFTLEEDKFCLISAGWGMANPPTSSTGALYLDGVKIGQNPAVGDAAAVPYVLDASNVNDPTGGIIRVTEVPGYSLARGKYRLLGRPLAMMLESGDHVLDWGSIISNAGFLAAERIIRVAVL